MNYKYKNISLKIVSFQNKILLGVVIFLSFCCLCLSVTTLLKEETFILIPANNIEKQLKLSNKTFYKSYLSEWTKSIMHELFTTSPLEIDSQIANLKAISDIQSLELEKFFTEQIAFIKGSKVTSVFFMKKFTELENNKVKISGTIHYWFGESDVKVSEGDTLNPLKGMRI